MKKIKVLVVDDSLTAQKLLVAILNNDPQIEVSGVASSGEEALKQLESTRPDLITMDIHMPGLNGLTVTRQIMETRPLPIVVVSSSALVTDIERAFQLIDAGALTAVAKPTAVGHPEFHSSATRLVQTVKDMSSVKVIRRLPAARLQQPSFEALAALSARKPAVIAIGASTGGPPVIETILKEITGDYPPVLLVQHIAPGFLNGMVEWLKHTLKLRVKVAEDNESLQRSTVYLSPEGQHLGTASGRIKLSTAPPVAGHRPAVSHLFATLAADFGSSCLAILLTGMGRDGADGLLELKSKGAVTVVQNEESSVVFGMPRAAIELGADCHVLSPNGMAALLADVQNH